MRSDRFVCCPLTSTVAKWERRTGAGRQAKDRGRKGSQPGSRGNGREGEETSGRPEGRQASETAGRPGGATEGRTHGTHGRRGERDRQQRAQQAGTALRAGSYGAGTQAPTFAHAVAERAGGRSVRGHGAGGGVGGRRQAGARRGIQGQLGQTRRALAGSRACRRVIRNGFASNRCNRS